MQDPHVRRHIHKKPHRPHHRRQHPQHHFDPVLTRKGSFAHPGRIVLAAGGILFGAYVFNLGGTEKYLDTFFRNLEHDLHQHDAAVSSGFLAALPILGILLAALLTLMLVRGLSRASATIRKARTFRGREELTLPAFIAMAAEGSVSNRIARETYHLLLPHYRERMRALSTDRLIRDLQLTPLAVRDLYGTLLRMTDRQRSRTAESAPMHTIADLMQAAERCEERSLSRSKEHLRARNEQATPVPASPRRSLIRPVAIPTRPAGPRNGTTG